MGRIVHDEAIRDGQPFIQGTRVTVADILAEFSRNRSLAELLRVFPTLDGDAVREALAYAAACVAKPRTAPQVSFVVIIHDMPEQASRTLHTLSTAYQRGVCRHDYEVVIVENESLHVLGKHAALDHDFEGRYYFQRAASKSPVEALNFGAAEARAPMLALMVDGARMLTPGIAAAMIAARRVDDAALVAVPGYHLGRELQQTAAGSGYDEQSERDLLRSIAFPEDGYRLFDIACLSGSCRAGFFSGMAESNCIGLPREAFGELGGYDAAFDLPGGGYCNLDFFARCCAHPPLRYFVTPGEGTFHQFHAGITTGGLACSDRKRYLEEAARQYEKLRGHAWTHPGGVPTHLGIIPRSAHRFVRLSAGEPGHAKEPALSH